MRENFANSLSQISVNIAKWTLGLNGAGLAVSFALIISSYTVIPQVKDCQSIAFISDSMTAGAFFARVFSFGVASSIFTIIIPPMVGICRNTGMFLRKNVPQSVNFMEVGREFENYDASSIFGFAFLQYFSLALSTVMFFIAFITMINLSGRETPQAIMETWDNFGKTNCTMHHS